jgi:hypothetical protein
LLHEGYPLTVDGLNVANIQIISSLAKHHSKQVWISALMMIVLTFYSIPGNGAVAIPLLQ